MVRSGIVFVFRSCRQGCGLRNKSLARINFAIITKGITKISVTPNYFVILLAGMAIRRKVHLHLHSVIVSELSGPLNRLNAILSLLHPLDRYRTHSTIWSAIGRPLPRPISHPHTGGSPQPPCSKPLRGLNRAIVAL